MLGIISKDDISEVGHSLFKNFRLGLKNYLQEEMKDVNCTSDLDEVDILFIIDEHYIPHKELWQTDEFIDCINSKNIKVIIFNFEKIFNSQFPWNIDIQRRVEKINNRIQLVSDIRDASILNTSIINKQLLSKSTILLEPVNEKKDEILFIGQINEFYLTRGAIITELQKLNDKVKVIKTDRKYSYNEFLNLLNNAKFILNPLGTGNFINLRFYEALNLECIVLQQYTDEMESFYSDELSHPSVIKFKTVDELCEKLKAPIDFIPFNKTLEDYFEDINLKNIINNIS